MNRHGQDCEHEHHEHEGHDHDHDHDHDHGSGGPPPNNLYARVDRRNVAALNAEEGSDPCAALKPWHERLDETKVRCGAYSARPVLLTEPSRLVVTI
jgi:hypothetical protein